MFIGHLGVALGCKRAAPRTSLGLLLIAASLSDLIFPLMLALGFETVQLSRDITFLVPLEFVYPWSHSLLLSICWGAILGVLYFWRRSNSKGGLVLFALVLSHWILDWISHRPDMPLAPGAEIFVGLSLWSSLAGTLVVEGGLFIGGLLLYLRTTTARDRIGFFAMWGWTLFISGIYVMGLVGPPPPAEQLLPAVIMVNASSLIYILWAHWFDQHRHLSHQPDQ